MKTVTRTLRLKVKPESYAWLNKAAIEVNQVWNWANEISAKAARPFYGAPKRLSGFYLNTLSAGAASEFMANAEAETLMECNTDADGEWVDAETEAEYRRECAIIDAARSELAGLRGRVAAAEREVDRRRIYPLIDTLPGCMMPDGAEPCAGFTEIRERLGRQAMWHTEEAAGRQKAETQRDRLAEALREAADAYGDQEEIIHNALAAIDTETKR